jgi:Tfp pilus assembly protein PilO
MIEPRIWWHRLAQVVEVERAFERQTGRLPTARELASLLRDLRASEILAHVLEDASFTEQEPSREA